MGRWRQNLRKDSFLPSNNCKTFGNISSNTDSMDSRLSYKSQRPWHFLTSTFYRQGFVDVGGVYVGISSCLSGLIAEFWAYSASRRSGSWRKNASIGTCWSISKSDLNFWFSWKSKKWVLTQVTPITVVSPSGVARATNQQPHSKLFQAEAQHWRCTEAQKWIWSHTIKTSMKNRSPEIVQDWKRSLKNPRLEIQCTTGVCHQLSMSPVIHAECANMCYYDLLCASCRFASRQRNLFLTSLLQKSCCLRLHWYQVVFDLKVLFPRTCFVLCMLKFVCIYSRISMFHMFLNCLDWLWFASLMKFTRFKSRGFCKSQNCLKLSQVTHWSPMETQEMNSLFWTSNSGIREASQQDDEWRHEDIMRHHDIWKGVPTGEDIKRETTATAVVVGSSEPVNKSPKVEADNVKMDGKTIQLAEAGSEVFRWIWTLDVLATVWFRLNLPAASHVRCLFEIFPHNARDSFVSDFYHGF